jgi:Ca2+-transporting ATPase
MEGLLSLEVGRAHVLRPGSGPEEVEAARLVPGDVIELEAGSMVPADARLLDSVELATAEAALTGESVPVAKDARARVEADDPLPARRTMVYKGTTVVAGHGRAVVVATGMRTEVGRIGELAAGITEEPTPLERRLEQLGRQLAWFVFGLAALTVLVGWFHEEPFALVLQRGLALAVAAVPEGLPAVATITLAAGVARMARRRALVRRLPAVETLGAVTVICTDKTGTLTTGEMTVTDIWLPGRAITVSGVGWSVEGQFWCRDHPITPADDIRLLDLLRIGVLANQAALRVEGGRVIGHGDPTEAALLVAARKAGLDETVLRREWPRAGEVPFSSERMYLATFHRRTDALLACLKGAPARVLERCDAVLASEGVRPLATEDRAGILAANRTLAGRGLRVLAFAEGSVDSAQEASLRKLTFVGLVGLIDPPAPGVAETIGLFRGAGIRTVMLTGDQRDTALAVARALGLLASESLAVDGSVLARSPPHALGTLAGKVTVVSRISPEGKLRLVEALRRAGEVVAVLGDGVNDAAALRGGDVGVAMGGRGTDLAKEAADVILLDDRFATVGAAIEEGRILLDNIRKAAFYLFSCNLAEVIVVVGAGLAGTAQPLAPLQILWLNLITDTLPALALTLEPGEPEVMRRPPLNPKAPLLPPGLRRGTLGYASLISAVTLAAFALGGRWYGPGSAEAGTMAFMTLAFAQIFHLGNARATGDVLHPTRMMANPVALGALVVALALQTIPAIWPALGTVLAVTRLAPEGWLLVLGLAAIPAVLGQTLKLHRRIRSAGGGRGTGSDSGLAHRSFIRGRA